MEILKRLYGFNVPKRHLVQIYTLFIRSVTEQSSVVWSPSITEEESCALERTQKVALKIIYRHEYISYENTLKMANLRKMVQRREDLLFKLWVKTLNNPKTSHVIKKNEPSKLVRNLEKYTVKFARTT